MTTLLMIHRTASEDDNVTVDNVLLSISTATNNIRPPPAKRRVTHDTHLHLSHNSDLETIPANGALQDSPVDRGGSGISLCLPMPLM